MCTSNLHSKDNIEGITYRSHGEADQVGNSGAVRQIAEDVVLHAQRIVNIQHIGSVANRHIDQPNHQQTPKHCLAKFVL